MVEQRRRPVQRNQRKKQEPGQPVRLEQLAGDRAVRRDQRRQPAEQEEIDPVPARIGLQEPEDGLQQQERVERLLACPRRHAHQRGHVLRKGRVRRESPPHQACHRQREDGEADGTVQVQDRRVRRLRCRLVDRESKPERGEHQRGGEPVQRARGGIEHADGWGFGARHGTSCGSCPGHDRAARVSILARPAGISPASARSLLHHAWRARHESLLAASSR